MKQCPECLRFYYEEDTRCPICECDLPSDEASSEDEGVFQEDTNGQD